MTSQGVTTSTLIIPNVTEEDIGKYYCQVWANDIGVKSKPATLYLSGSYNTIAMYIHTQNIFVVHIIHTLPIYLINHWCEVDGYQ